MCNRYTLSVAFADNKLLSMLQMCGDAAEERQNFDVKNLESILPSDYTPALMVANSKIKAVLMQWGFDSGAKLIINARSESVKERPMFKTLADHQRCLLPATGYYEWRDGDGLRHLIARGDSRPFYLAGLYRSDKKGQLHFVILTRQAYGRHAKIHSRMPCALFSKDTAKQWLSGRMPVEQLYATETDDFSIEVQGIDQIRMEFDD